VGVEEFQMFNQTTSMVLTLFRVEIVDQYRLSLSLPMLMPIILDKKDSTGQGKEERVTFSGQVFRSAHKPVIRRYVHFT
jgi:hypothetical protein